MKYNEANLAWVIGKIIKLRDNKALQIEPFLKHIELEIEKLIRSGTRVKTFGRSTFYGRLKKPVNLTNVFDEEVFKLFVEYLKFKGVLVNTEDKPSPYALLSSVSDNSNQDARNAICGYFRTYKTAIGKPGHVVTGILRITANKDDDTLETCEVLRYKLHATQKRSQTHSYQGLIWSIRDHFIMHASDSNTKFINQWVLRKLYSREDGTIEALEGAYSGITNKRGGTKIFWSKIYLERIHSEPGTLSWREELRKTIGYKHPESKDRYGKIDPDIWEKLDPISPHNIILF